ncbi:polysaccharide biosynthesis protein [Clostridium thermarum]|uniref:polysaccharide biosynthesis protein n=1 Tax=Clostridium thermarum TaxID=1716543 RepID=UPI00111F860A|nr:nucleoside-diphosphate sugar epimerase/dehydratase [Clostridium thermarum]
MDRLSNCRIAALLILDTFLINASYALTLYFRFSSDIPPEYIEIYLKNIVVINIIYLTVFYLFKLYKSLWIYAGIDEFLLSIGGCIAASTLVTLYELVAGFKLPFKMSLLNAMINVVLIVGFRMSFRIYRRLIIQFGNLNKKDFKKVLIVGAGSAGVITINEMKKRPEMKYLPVGFIDDNLQKIGKIVAGVKVLDSTRNIKKIAREKQVEEIIITIPSLDVEGKRKLIELCKETGCKVKLLPSLHELIDEKVTLNHIREVEVEDLLGREPVTLDTDGIKEYIIGKTVLVTGGGGSIGSELCRQIIKFYPKQLLIIDSYENNAYDLYNEIIFKNKSVNIKVIITNVTDKKRLEKIFTEFKPNLVFHAAAHKHVPLMEDNPTEAIKNNVFGTFNVAECADKYGAEKFVLISTDKAVNPTNIMGASKRICEMIVQAMDTKSATEFVAVRFGNVLGSNGSVIPLFKRQIAQGGPVTVTNKYITRYFMTITEAAQLVLQAGAYAEGGEIFVLDMGKAVKIYDLACDLIRLSGFEPHKDIKIEVTGLRPGEKLYEELLLAEEGLNETRHKKIFIGRPTFNNLEVLKKGFDELRFIIEQGSREDLFRKVEELVPTYRRYPEHSERTEELAATLKTEDMN